MEQNQARLADTARDVFMALNEEFEEVYAERHGGQGNMERFLQERDGWLRTQNNWQPLQALVLALHAAEVADLTEHDYVPEVQREVRHG